MLSCEFCEISKNIFLTEHLWTTASVTMIQVLSDTMLKHSLKTLKGSYMPSIDLEIYCERTPPERGQMLIRQFQRIPYALIQEK